MSGKRFNLRSATPRDEFRNLIRRWSRMTPGVHDSRGRLRPQRYERLGVKIPQLFLTRIEQCASWLAKSRTRRSLRTSS